MKSYLSRYLLLLILSTISQFSFSQAPPIQWQKVIGGSNWDCAFYVEQTSDNGYIMAGTTGSSDGDATGSTAGGLYWNAWVVKVNSAGTIQWQKDFGGNSFDEAECIRQTSDGGYIMVGYTQSGTDADYLVVKLNSAGDMVWQKTLGGSFDDIAYWVEQTTDGGYVITGVSDSNNGDVSGNHGLTDTWIVRLDSQGDVQWQKSLGGAADDGAMCTRQTTDGGFIVGGYTKSSNGDVSGNHGAQDCWVVKLTPDGNIQWSKALGGSGDDGISSIRQTNDGGYIVAGSTTSLDGDVSANHGNTDFWIVKLDINGTIQWEKSYGGSDNDYAFSIQQTTDGGYLVGGETNSFDGDIVSNKGQSDYWLIKTDNTGNIQWQQTFGGSDREQLFAIQQTTDGGIIVGGQTFSTNGDIPDNYHGDGDFWIIKLNHSPTPVTWGDFTGRKQNTTVLLEWTILTEINCKSYTIQRKLPNGEFADIGVVQSKGDSYFPTAYKFRDNQPGIGTNYYRIKQTDKDGKISLSKEIAIKFEESNPIAVKIYPNPTTGDLTIRLAAPYSGGTLHIYDVSGRNLLSGTLLQMNTVSLNQFPKGIYYIRIIYGEQVVFVYPVVRK